MRHYSLVIISVVFLIGSTDSSAQQTYFNNVFNPYNTYAIGLSVANNDSGYLCVGNGIETYNDNKGIIFLKIDSIGNYLSSYVWSDTSAIFYPGSFGSLQSYKPNGYILTGSVNRIASDSSLIFLSRLNNTGRPMWTYYYTDSSSSFQTPFITGEKCLQTSDNHILISGMIKIPGNYNQGIHLLKIDTLGNVIWKKQYSNYNKYDVCRSLVQTPDSGFVLGAYTCDLLDDASGDAWVVKLDKNGNKEWDTIMGSVWDDGLAYIAITQDSNILAAYSKVYELHQPGNPLTAHREVCITKISSAGKHLWTKTYPKHLDIMAKGIKPITQNCNVIYGYYNFNDSITGDYGEMGFIMKVNDNGNLIWWRNLWYVPIMQNLGELHFIYDVLPTSDNGFITCGQARSYFMPQSAWFVKLDSMGNIWTSIEPEPVLHDSETFSVYPNPSIGSFFVELSRPIQGKLQVISSLGQLCQEIALNGPETVPVHLSGFNNGIFLLRFISASGIVSEKKIVIRR